ncbi:TetR family transcriptional regulator [Luteitalea sp. TBR-22]|uniref:TetR/AcrR family transcriptional regulator n=1 Tax=Luteitalea sp. TBR-22 TaxID=2802971 RepID=UPI001AF09E33|nr:TetR/AcrR family transcriptional regulator [Luteitalea sp. TBR-22]BCS32330.1 TetR family transcriptional regulator [Luteitalea sp. TBR-22]
MGIAERRQRQKAQVRQEILTAARAMFAEEGFEAVTMRKLAARIEYSPTAIYLHFKDKHAVLEAVCEETFGQLAERLAKLAAKGLPPLEFLREGLRLYVQFGLQHPSDYTLTFTMRTGKDEASPEAFSTSAGFRAFDYLRQALRGCIASGDLPPIDVDVAAQSLWAATHGIVSLLIAHGGLFPFVSRKKLVDHTLDTMIAGLQASAR